VTIPHAVYLLRIYVSASEHRRGKLFYKLIVQTARALSLAGASVFPVEMSFGATHQIRDAQSDYGFSDLPVVIEIVDEIERIESLFTELGELIDSILVTIEPVRVFSDLSRELP
jgi:PII-like signaling protein